MKIKCYSVRIKELVEISEKCFKAFFWDGGELLIPKSQIYELDFDVKKSDSIWISAWFIEKSNVQFSRKKTAIYDTNKKTFVPIFKIEKHIPEKKNITNFNNEIKELLR